MLLRLVAPRAAAAVAGGAYFSYSSVRCSGNEDGKLIFDAIERRDVSMIRRLAKEGEGLEARNRHGLTPLLLAASAHDGARMVEVLVDAGACPNASDKFGRTALHFVSLGGNTKATRHLLEGGASVSMRDVKRGATPAHYAAAFSRLEVLRLLVQNGTADERDNLGRTPLHWAALSSFRTTNKPHQRPSHLSVEISRLLLEHGASPAARDRTGSTPAHTAACYENHDFLDLLVDDNTDLLNEQNNRGVTPLDIAVANYEKSRYKARFKFGNLELKITAPRLRSLGDSISSSSTPRRPKQ